MFARIRILGDFALASHQVADSATYAYNRSSPVRWIISHLLRYKLSIVTFLLASVIGQVLFLRIQILIGKAFDDVLRGQDALAQLQHAVAMLFLIAVIFGALDLLGRYSSEFLAKRLERDIRAELFLSLLSKSQTFHNRQRVGDLMARASGDIQQISGMIVPGIDVMVGSFLVVIVTISYVALLKVQLLLAPLLFTAGFILTLRLYMINMSPVQKALRDTNGALSADLAECITGVDVVKATAQEKHERDKFASNATRYYEAYERNGRVQALYLPPLVLSAITAGAFTHGAILVLAHQLSVGSLVAYMGLMWQMRYPAGISDWTFNMVGAGIAATARILHLLRAEEILNEPTTGYHARLKGTIVFDRVSFGYGDGLVLRDISFCVEPGQTIAVVGQTGAGKTSLTKLINRIYDVQAGRILVDGIDVREWDLSSLREQIGVIEQDVFLFSRSVAENIAFGQGQHANRSSIVQAAKEAQAHDFIMSLKNGYDTLIGERGVTLSGGERQRLSIARALLTDPRLLIVDDSTSAIDSATEDRIQGAMQRLMYGRTALLITHRISQIRRADIILVLRQGLLVDSGSHEELLSRCTLYRSIFAHHQNDLAPAETEHDL